MLVKVFKIICKCIYNKNESRNNSGRDTKIYRNEKKTFRNDKNCSANESNCGQAAEILGPYAAPKGCKCSEVL